MNWILENKNTNSPRKTILQKAKLWWGGISRDKKIKTLIASLFLVCIFCLAAHTAYAGTTPTTTSPAAAITIEKDPGFSDYVKNPLGSALLGIKVLMGFLVTAAATLFGVVINANNVSGDNGILNMKPIKDVWIMVRDTLNMFFILVLLFSAFCTIFQVEKWNLKKIWLNILINALLVNFSFPIARFIIDISNVAMYYFVTHLFSDGGQTPVSGSKIFADFGSVARLGPMMNPAEFVKAPLSYELAIIIFLFILGMTLLVVAILFLVRLVALAMLIMFSPIGFVGYIFPATAKYADDWWEKLFSYSFFAPIMIFIMSIALQICRAMGDNAFASFAAGGASNAVSNDQGTFIASAAFFCIPIVVLWMGMGVAKKMGIAGAESVVGGAQKFSKSVGSWAAKAPWKAAKWGANQTGIPGGIKKGLADARKSGQLFGKDIPLLKDRREEKEAGYGALINRGGDAKKAAENKFRDKAYNEKIKESAELQTGDGQTLGDKIAKADLANSNDPKKDAMEIGAMLSHLKSNPDKKEAYEASLRENVLNGVGENENGVNHKVAMKDMSDMQKEAYVRKQISQNWKSLNAKGDEARKIFTGETSHSDLATKAKAENEAHKESEKRKAQEANAAKAEKEEQRKNLTGIDPGKHLENI